MNNNRVLVGMSGGVDSSVTAAILLEKGFEVIGITIKPFNLEEYLKKDIKEDFCKVKTSIIDARSVCDCLGIEHIVVDFSDYFKENVVNYFVDEYLEGRTPNPCVKCNPIIKWGELLKEADKLDAQYIATGHYARIFYDDKYYLYKLFKGSDSKKDQSYFLWKLSQNQLSRTIFPLGNIEKKDTRKLAEKFNLPVYNKPESQEICFITDNDYKNFLRNAVPDIDNRIGFGNILLDGKVIGKHKGYPFYTIGQRKGLGISYKEPLFVKEIIPKTNTIIVCRDEELLEKRLMAHSLNFISENALAEPRKLSVKIRYKDPGHEAICQINNEGLLQVNFIESRRAITPGQSVVMYEGDELIGGGVILV